MKPLELEIRQKTKTEIIEVLQPIVHKIGNRQQASLYIPRHKITWNLLEVHILAQKSLLNIKLKYYKRNIALLEILLDKQNLSNNLTLALRIVREHLELKHISQHINTYNWFRIYSEKRLPNYLLKQILL